MDKHRLARVEEYVLGFFRRAGRAKALARELFEGSAVYANADIVRALEDLEKRQRLLVRHTEEGGDWVSLTPEGARLVGLPPSGDEPTSPPPPKSST